MDEMEQLAYQNRFVRQLVQDLTNYSEASCEDKTPQVVSGDDNLIILRVSLEEWTRLLSSVFTGADICYPSESDSVRWSLLRAVECPVDICELIADCIANSEATKAALRNFLATDPETQNIINTIAGRGVPVPETTLVSTTNYDALFGAITFLVDTMYDAIVDFNGLAEITTNFRERGILLFEAIPVIETAPVDEVFQFIDTIYEDVMEVFDAQWSTTPITGSRDRIRCGLFCLAKLNDGVLTWEMVAGYFWEQVSFVPAGPVVGVIAQFVAFLATGNWTGQAVVDISFANFATAMTVGQRFGDLLFPSMDTVMQLGLNDPDPDWPTLCLDCVEPDDTRTPIINSDWDAPNIAGTLSGPDEDGFWTLTSTFRTTDWAFCVMDIEERPFVLTNITYSVQSACQVFLNGETMIYIGCDFTNHYTGQTITEFWSTWEAPAGAQTMTFKMVAP